VQLYEMADVSEAANAEGAANTRSVTIRGTTKRGFLYMLISFQLYYKQPISMKVLRRHMPIYALHFFIIP
jgi:hypothetical protein